MTTVDRAGLEAERAFLLRSLDDLEAEHADGNVDDETYRTLHDDYTARAATVIRALEGEPVANLHAPPRRGPVWMRVATFGLVVVFAVGSAFALTRAVGTREEGDTITGNDAATSAGDLLETLRRAADDAPDDYGARIAYARALLGQDPAEALAQYDAARSIDATQAEPPTYIGWITALAAQGLDAGAERDGLVEESLAWFDRAVSVDEEYEDAYVFRALVRFNVLGDAAAAVPDFQQFLVLAPQDHPMRETVRGALEQAVAQASTTVTSSS